MKFSAVIEGLQILAKYADEGLDAAVAAGDDRIYADLCVDVRASKEDAERLEQLGWFDGGDGWWQASC